MRNKPRFGFVLEYVKDIEAARQFSVETLGLTGEQYSPTFVQFNNFAIASDLSLVGNRDIELYWFVDDAETAFKDLSQKAEVILSLKQVPSGKAFGIKDPTGQPRNFLEFCRELPGRPTHGAESS